MKSQELPKIKFLSPKVISKKNFKKDNFKKKKKINNSTI